MKKILVSLMVVVLSLTTLLAIPTEASSKPSFSDKNLYKYASEDTFQVKKNVLYVESKGKFIKPSEKYTKNATLRKVTESLLDKKRYTRVHYSNKTVYINAASTRMASMMGLKPLSFIFYTDKRATRNGVKNIRSTIILDYSFYDSITKKNNSSVYKAKLKDSLIAQFGSKTGKSIYSYVISVHQKQRKNIPDTGKVKKTYKKIGNIKVYTRSDDTNMFVDFSY